MIGTGTGTTTITTIAIATAIAEENKKKLKCEEILKKDLKTTATIEQKQEYSDCINLIQPHDANAGAIGALMFSLLVVIALSTCAIVAIKGFIK